MGRRHKIDYRWIFTKEADQQYASLVNQFHSWWC